MKRPYYEIGRKIQTIIKSKQPVAKEMEAIIALLKKTNESFGKPRNTPSLSHGMNRAFGLAQDELGAKIARQCLKYVKQLCDFEDIRVHLEGDNPIVKKRDIDRLKRTDWPEKSPRMEELLFFLEKLKDGDNEEIEYKRKWAGEESGKRKTTPLEEARFCLDRICIGAKLVFTVKMASIIASDYLERKDIEIPKNDKLFSANPKKLSEDKNIRTHQLLYDLTVKVNRIVEVFVIDQNWARYLDQGLSFKMQFKKITGLFDKDARVPTDITKENYHVVATFLHVLERLQVAIDGDEAAKSRIQKVWKTFYPKTFDNGNDFKEDLSKNPMLVNLQHFVEAYEEENGLKKDQTSAEKQAEVIVGHVAEEEEEDDLSSSSSSGSFHSFG